MGYTPESRPCKACGMPIEFREGPNGKMIPLQRVKSIYFLRDPLYGGALEHATGATFGTVEAIYVSHFETCPSASDFHRNRS